LERAAFLRYGSLHRNTFIHSPSLLTNTLQLRMNPALFFAGQITGVEGYVESTAMGLLAGVNAGLRTAGRPGIFPPPTTAMGSLVHYITNPQIREFQPMNVNFGLFPPFSETAARGRDKKKAVAERALRDIEGWLATVKVHRSPSDPPVSAESGGVTGIETSSPRIQK